MVRRAPKGFRDKAKGGKGKSLSKRAISEISDAARFAEKIGSDKSFSDLAKEYKQTNVKYDRPAVFRANYGDETNKVGTPLASTYYKDPSGIERFFTAAPPTLSQLGGDIARAFTGYNTLSYDPTSTGTPTTTGGFIERQPGIMSNIDFTSFIPGVGMAKKLAEGIKGVYDFMFPKPAVVNYGGTSNITVREEPIDSGVMTVFPYNFDTELKTKPETPGEFSAIDNPALYGDGTFFDNYDQTMASMGITPVGFNEGGQSDQEYYNLISIYMNALEKTKDMVSTGVMSMAERSKILEEMVRDIELAKPKE